MRSDVIALVDTLSRGQATPGQAHRLYDEVVLELAASTVAVTTASLVVSGPSSATYVMPTEAVRLLSVFYDNRELTLTDYKSAAASYGTLWRGLSGAPLEYTTENETSRTVRLIPAPNMQAESYIPLGSALGLSYPGYNIVMLHTETRTDLPAWLELYVALEVLSREYARDSTHRDAEASKAWGTLAGLVLKMVM